MHAMNLKIHRKTDPYTKQWYYVQITPLPAKVEAPIPTEAYVPLDCLITLDRLQQQAHGVLGKSYRDNLLHGNGTKNLNFYAGWGLHVRACVRIYIYIYVYTCVCVFVYVYTHTHTCVSRTDPALLLGLIGQHQDV